MGFINNFKTFSNLKKAITLENQKFDEIKKLHKKELEDLVKKNDDVSNKLEENILLLDNKEKTINDIRNQLEINNVDIRKKIIAIAESEALKKTNDAALEAKKTVDDANFEVTDLMSSIAEYRLELEQLTNEKTDLIREVNRYKTQARKFKSDITGIKSFNRKYEDALSCDVDSISDVVDKIDEFLDEDGLLDTVIKLPLHSDNSKELRKLSNATRKEINNVLEKYESRYSTKGNKTIYTLMIIGLQAEMQLLLYKLAYQKIDDTKNSVKEITAKYLVISGQGNKSILPTISRFIAEIEPLYLELTEIEYRYYIHREEEKEEQRAIKEQMKQEAAERKLLEAERKKLEKEELKYSSEMDRNKELLAVEKNPEKIIQLEKRLKELQEQLNAVEDKKEEVASLSLGKAGYVYVISNLGSFGENVFKIGMTRRLDPQQRVDELGSASVPFKFDVHAMIFSDDAVGLENDLHKRLTNTRINKANFRKEFFKSDINSLEILVDSIDPTAEFIKTMYAEEYNQTIAIENSSELIA